MSKEILTSQYLESLYSKQDDEEVLKLEDAPGLTVLRKYPLKYNKDDYRMFLRFYILEGNLVFGGANTIEKKTSYILDDKNFANFSLDDSDKIIFDLKKNRIILKRWGFKRKFTVNQFIELLIKNHLHNKYLSIRLLRKIKIYYLKLIFWFVDKHYDWSDYQDEIYKIIDLKKGRNSEIKPEPIPIPEMQEPFFKYFHIYRKMLLIFMIIVFIVLVSGFSIYSKSLMGSGNFMMIFNSEYFTVANPILLLIFFLSLSFLHYLSKYLTKQFSNKDSFIVKIHYSLLTNKFKLKIY